MQPTYIAKIKGIISNNKKTTCVKIINKNSCASPLHIDWRNQSTSQPKKQQRKRKKMAVTVVTIACIWYTLQHGVLPAQKNKHSRLGRTPLWPPYNYRSVFFFFFWFQRTTNGRWCSVFSTNWGTQTGHGFADGQKNKEIVFVISNCCVFVGLQLTSNSCWILKVKGPVPDFSGESRFCPSLHTLSN